MFLKWFDARQATAVGISLADHFASEAAPGSQKHSGRKSPQKKHGDALRDFLQRAEREVRALSLNFYKKAKLANSFKWRLLEKGMESAVAAEVTQTLVMHLSMNRLASATGRGSPAPALANQPETRSAHAVLAEADRYVADGAYAEAANAYEEFIKLKPRHARALNNLGAAYWKLGRYQEAEQQFRRSIGINPKDPDAHSNLGGVLRGKGHLTASENSLRRALKLDSGQVEARASLGLTLFALGRPTDARPHFEKVLKVAPAHVAALLGMAKIATTEGRFDEAETLTRRVLAINPTEPGAWAALASLRKMTAADGEWLQRAEAISAGAITPLEEIDLRFAIGKYRDDVGDFPEAFQSYKRANDLLKAGVGAYDRAARSHFVEEFIRVHAPGSLDRDRQPPPGGTRNSAKPILVVGMMRSGTSLVEQIIASHPAAAGAGELGFWSNVVRHHETDIRQGSLREPLRQELASAYLRDLTRQSPDALRVVDKAPVNSDYLGLIHSVFPNARIIYMRRDPIDTCLSCYFQQFSAGLDFTMDLSDLAHYYRTHHRLIEHWRAVLPVGTVLDVPYAELVADQETWIRRILDFVGLEWDGRCLDFQNTKRTVATASAWQVRQKIYRNSVERWRNYEQFVGPLLELRDLTW